MAKNIFVLDFFGCFYIFSLSRNITYSKLYNLIIPAKLTFFTRKASNKSFFAENFRVGKSVHNHE